MSLSDNEIGRLMPDIGNFINLMELDISKNGRLFLLVCVNVYLQFYSPEGQGKIVAAMLDVLWMLSAHWLGVFQI